MQAYVDLPFGEHMAFLVRALDGDPDTVRPPTLAPLPATADEGLVREAVAFLRRTHLPIEPRLQWPAGGMPRMRASGRIGADRRAMPGRALSVWRDAGWGTLVARGRQHDGRFDEALIGACVAMVRAWGPRPAPAWVACVPSLRQPGLVPDFAGRLAAALGLPFLDLLARSEARPEQAAMANAIQRARNLDGALALRDAAVPGGPVLLVDDRVDSRWTFAVCAWLLRRGGSGGVHPLAGRASADWLGTAARLGARACDVGRQDIVTCALVGVLLTVSADIAELEAVLATGHRLGVPVYRRVASGASIPVAPVPAP